MGGLGGSRLSMRPSDAHVSVGQTLSVMSAAISTSPTTAGNLREASTQSSATDRMVSKDDEAGSRHGRSVTRRLAGLQTSTRSPSCSRKSNTHRGFSPNSEKARV